MLRLFQIQITILDDCTFNADQMKDCVQEALEVHVEAIKCQVDDVQCFEVIGSLTEVADA
jgi:hypothetical protein